MDSNAVPTHEHVPGVGSYTWLLRDNHLQWGSDLLPIYGFDTAPAAAEDFFRRVHPDDCARIRREMHEVIARAATYTHEFRIVLPDGQVRHLLDKGVVERDAAGEALCLKGVEVDVTELRSPTGGKYSGSEFVGARIPLSPDDMLEAVFTDAPMGIGILDRDLRFLKVNSALADMNGLPPQDHIGRRITELLPDIADLDAIESAWHGVLDSGAPLRNFEVTGATPANPREQRFWREHFFPVRSSGSVVGVATLVEDTTEVRQARDRIDILLRELNHRSKNMISLILAIARQTARSQPENFHGVFQARLESMAAAQDLLVQQEWRSIRLIDLIHSQISYLEAFGKDRVDLVGDAETIIEAEAAQPLALALHELTTNALKYGALSGPSGRLVVSWDSAEDGRLTYLKWVERGGPRVDRTRLGSGFGSVLTSRMLQSSLAAEVVADYAPEGLSWSLILGPK